MNAKGGTQYTLDVRGTPLKTKEYANRSDHHLVFHHSGVTVRLEEMCNEAILCFSRGRRSLADPVGCLRWPDETTRSSSLHPERTQDLPAFSSPMTTGTPARASPRWRKRSPRLLTCSWSRRESTSPARASRTVRTNVNRSTVQRCHRRSSDGLCDRWQPFRLRVSRPQDLREGNGLSISSYPESTMGRTLGVPTTTPAPSAPHSKRC